MYKKHEDVYIDIYDIFSALLWPVWNHIPKVLYICLYVRVRERVPCTEIPPLLSIFLRSSFYHTSSLFIAILRIVIEPIGSYATYDRRSLSLSFHYSIYLSLSLSRVRPSGACVNVLTPCSSLELFISLGSKRGLIITIPKNFYLNFFPQDLYILLHNYFPTFHPFQYIILDRIVQSVYSFLYIPNIFSLTWLSSLLSLSLSSNLIFCL